MGFTTKRIQSVFIQTGIGELILSGKTGEDPELKLFTDSVEDSDDGMTNDGQLIVNALKARSYVQGVFGFKDSDIPFIQNNIQNAIATGNGQPINIVMTDTSIYSAFGVLTGDILYNGTGTMELKISSAQDWIF
jgi:hypothetical protein